MKKETKENIWQMKLKYPINDGGVEYYIGIPTDFMLKNRLHLREEQITIIRQSFAQYQDVVREVLQECVDKHKSMRERMEKNRI